MLLAGIEEAGRGPVIGPLVLAVAAIEEKKEKELQELGVKDSKMLSAKQREALFNVITDMCEYEIIVVHPEEIDLALESANSNLNWLEAEKMAELINMVNPEKVIIDCPSNNIESYEEYIKKRLRVSPKEMLVKHKADRDHVIVGAASILAKVTRDKEIEKIKKRFKIEFGSGYPSDPSTVKFLKENWDKYPIFRKTWETWKKASKSKSQKRIGDY